MGGGRPPARAGYPRQAAAPSQGEGVWKPWGSVSSGGNEILHAEVLLNA